MTDIRQAIAADIPVMHHIRSTVTENALSDPGRLSERDYFPFVDAGSAWVAESTEAVIGFAALDASSGNVWALFVEPGAQQFGVGRALHDHMLAWARDQGLQRLWLTTGPATRAEGFYRRSGWQEANRTDNGEIRFERTL